MTESTRDLNEFVNDPETTRSDADKLKALTTPLVDERLTSLGDDGYVSADDVMILRRSVFPDGIVSRAELTTIFALGEKAPDGDREWPQFFAEVCADFFLNEEDPRGYVTSAEFVELEKLVTRDGPQASRLEIAVLVRLMEKATSTPQEMADFVREQLSTMICSRQTPVIDAADTNLLRAFLYSSSGEGAIGITKNEAEFLFDLHDATANADNAPDWCDLFIKAIAAHLMQYVGYQPLPREEALRQHAWVSDHSVNVGGFFDRMFEGGLSGIRNAYRSGPSATRERLDSNAAKTEVSEMITAREAEWLAERIARNGSIDRLEKALIAYIKDLDAELPPKLKALVEKAA
ncbi:MAG: hypothetical protein AAF720_03710 [Pseudomonadota bacterium]